MAVDELPEYHNLEASDMLCRAKDELNIPMDISPGAPPMDPAASVSLDREAGKKDSGYITSYMHKRMAQQAQSSLNHARIDQFLKTETGR